MSVFPPRLGVLTRPDVPGVSTPTPTRQFVSHQEDELIANHDLIVVGEPALELLHSDLHVKGWHYSTHLDHGDQKTLKKTRRYAQQFIAIG